MLQDISSQSLQIQVDIHQSYRIQDRLDPPNWFYELGSFRFWEVHSGRLEQEVNSKICCQVKSSLKITKSCPEINQD